jgi:GNAT superfamily N-acetyltransferase
MSDPFEWRGFRDQRARRLRWQDDGYLGDEDSLLVVALPDGTFAGIVVWRWVDISGPRGCLEIGILLCPEHRGKGLGAAAQRLLADYLPPRSTISLSSGHWRRRDSSTRACCGQRDRPWRVARRRHVRTAAGCPAPQINAE